MHEKKTKNEWQAGWGKNCESIWLKCASNATKRIVCNIIIALLLCLNASTFFQSLFLFFVVDIFPNISIRYARPLPLWICTFSLYGCCLATQNNDWAMTRKWSLFCLHRQEREIITDGELQRESKWHFTRLSVISVHLVELSPWIRSHSYRTFELDIAHSQQKARIESP